jgi:pyruvate dehydrogenase E2 component (dihydrolipoamide acetyltransferase)
MPVLITVPRLGWNMEQGTFVEWLKPDGATVRPGDALFRLEGEKSTEDVEALDGGVLHIPADGPQPGDSVAVGAVVGYVLQPGEPPPVREAMNPDATPPDGIAPAVSPRAKRLAARLGIELSQLPRGSGRSGRVRERDVAALGDARQTPPASDLIPLTATRKAIAARMLESRRTTAPVTLTAVVDATNLANLRGQFQTVAKTDGAAVPSYTDFLVKLTTIALQKHPLLAARWTDDGIRPAGRIDVGIAVDTDAGLLVPVVRDVPALGLRQLAARTRELIDLARRGLLPARDMEGGCFTITNLGAYGIDAFTPIINPPECAVLGVGRIERRPTMDGERVVGREAVTLSLTFDHRVVDGGPAARFLQTLARLIENPGPWLST